MLTLARWLYRLTLAYGVFGLAGGACLESLGIPMAAAVIDMTAGILILNQRTTFVEAVLVADAGLVLGSLGSYFLGRTGSNLWMRKRRNLPAGRRGESTAAKWLEKHGSKAIFFGQLFGPTRTWISYPAGAMRMDVKKFTFYTALGGAVYCTVMITASLYLTDLIRRQIDIETASKVLGWSWIPMIAVGGLLWLVARRGRRQRLGAGLASTEQSR